MASEARSEPRSVRTESVVSGAVSASKWLIADVTDVLVIPADAHIAGQAEGSIERPSLPETRLLKYSQCTVQSPSTYPQGKHTQSANSSLLKKETP